MPGGTCGYTRCAHEGTACGQTFGGRFVAVELEQGVRNGITRSLDVLGAGVDEQQHRRDKYRQEASQFPSAFG